MEENLNIYLDYICPKCFRSPMKCTCEFKPWSLIFIDRNIQEHVRILNEKGYITNGCCESHYKGDCVDIYITFIRDCGFGKTISIPEDFKTMKNKNAVIYRYNNSNKITEKEMNEQKETQLNKLLEWCNNLPICTMR